MSNPILRDSIGSKILQSSSSNKIETDKALYILVLIIIPLAFGLISLSLGRDVNWDLKNYHYYNAYAFLENRLDFDIAPAQLQTFYNPLLGIPFYLMVRSFPSWVAGFVLGFVHGLNLSIILLIFWKTLNRSNSWMKLFMGCCLVAVSAIAPAFIAQLGNTMNDNITSLLALFAVLLLLGVLKANLDDRKQSLWGQVGLAGLVLGICVGLKPTSAVFAVGSAIALFFSLSDWKYKIISLITFGLTGSSGILLSAGFWWWEIWSRYGNPIFPYFNNIFKSPFANLSNFADKRFVPKEIWEYFLWPLAFSINSLRVSEIKFYDVRFAILYILALLWLLSTIYSFFFINKTVYNNTLFDKKLGNFLLIFFLASFIPWMVQSSYYRYIIGLELLVPLCFLIILERVFKTLKVKLIVMLSTLLLVMSIFRPYNWGRMGWGDSAYFHVDTTRLDTSQNAVVMMLGISPLSYVIPDFPENYRFVRTEGNLFMHIDNNGKFSFRGTDQHKFFSVIKELLDHHTGVLYILYNKEEQDVQPLESLLQLGINPLQIDCAQLIVNSNDQLELCQIIR